MHRTAAVLVLLSARIVAAEPLYSFPPGGVDLDGKKLTTQVWLVNAAPNTSFEVHLRGVGVADKPFVGETDSDGQFVSGRIAAIQKEPAASFDASKLKAGRYVLELVVGGKKVAERSVELLALPAEGAKPQLDVDFSTDIYQAVLVPTPYKRSDVRIIVPRDIRRAKVRYTLVQIADGKVCSHDTSDIETLHPAEQGLTSFLGHATVADALCMNAAKPTNLDIVLLRDAGDVIGAWHVAGDELTTVKMRSGPAVAGPVRTAKVPAGEALKSLQALAEESWRKDTNTDGHYADGKLTEIRAEGMLCALASYPRATTVLASLAELDHHAIDSADRYARAQDVLASKDSTAKQRAEARTEKQAMISGTTRATPVAKKLANELAAIVKRYPRGCFRKLYPAQFQPFL